MFFHALGRSWKHISYWCSIFCFWNKILKKRFWLSWPGLVALWLESDPVSSIKVLRTPGMINVFENMYNLISDPCLFKITRIFYVIRMAYRNWKICGIILKKKSLCHTQKCITIVAHRCINSRRDLLAVVNPTLINPIISPKHLQQKLTR